VSFLNLDTTEPRQLAKAAAAAAAGKLATDIHILDMGDLLGVTDYFVICSARNDRQLKTVADEVQERLKREQGVAPRRREGQPETGWMLLDYGIIIVHVFTEEQRGFYNLERLWADAPTTVHTDVPVPVPGGAADASA
jgi:ribosome-associated protein